MNYPFTAIVGQEKLKKALLLCAINPAIGGLLIQGDKGTAKSTAARALTEVIPAIKKVTYCLFNCAVNNPAAICDVCNQPYKEMEVVQVPFINLPLGATEDRVLGSMDLEAVLVEKKKKFQPGLLASVHQGILYIDEVNLLSDHLVDVLLDVSAMGENIIEREGLSLRHPSRFTLIGTMNPEEGQLRPQFLDRFGLMVHVEAPAEVAERTEVVRRRIAFESDANLFSARWQLKQEELQQRISKAKTLLPAVLLEDELLTLISELTTSLDVKSLRADIVMYKTAITIAALDHRTAVTADDIREAATFVLSHRSRKNPFSSHQSPTDPSRNNDQKESEKNSNAQNGGGRAEQDKNNREGGSGFTGEGSTKQERSTEKGNTGQPIEQENTHEGGDEAEKGTPEEQKGNKGGNQPGWLKEQVFNAGTPVNLPKIEAFPTTANHQLGRRSPAADVKRGLHVGSAPVRQSGDIAIDATVRHALLRDPDNFEISMADLQQKKRNGKTSNLILFVVDASGSMAASKRMEAVKGTVLSLLTDAYEKRDTVGVIAFRGIAAQVLLQPTQSIELAKEAMLTLPTGGRTPLPHALQTAIQLLTTFGVNKGYHPILVILTDGKANVALPGEGDDPWSQTLILAGQLKGLNIKSLVLNSESNYFNTDKARTLANSLGGEYLSLNTISEEQLTPIINQLSYKSR